MSEASFILEMHSISKTFPGVRALDAVDFAVKKGEIRGLVGKNGAGKSTLMNVLTGIYPADSGTVSVAGEQIENMTTAKARQAGIGYVHQHSQLLPALSVAENVFCGRLPTGALGMVDWKNVATEAAKLLTTVGLEVDVQRKVEELNVAERQMIEIAKALFANAKIIILDEATASLPKSEVQMLFGFVRRLAAQGVSFVYISHFLEEVFQLCDSVTVMRDGGVVGEYPVAELTQAKLVRLISGSDVQALKRTARSAEGKEVALSIEGLTHLPYYAEIGATLRKGEIVGLTGLDGCGKEQLVEGLAGIHPLGDGTVRLMGQEYRPASPEEAINRGVAYVPRDRQGLGIFGIRPVKENISLSVLKKLQRSLGFLDRRTERAHVQRFVNELGVVTPSLNQEVGFLSGGNQQKVVFARVAGIALNVLLLHEPTQGVDVQAKVEILRIVDEMAKKGVAVLLVSEEIRELMDVCDRIIVMYAGKTIREFVSGEAQTSASNILLAIEGGTDSL